MIRVNLTNDKVQDFADAIVIDPQGDWVYFYNEQGETIGIIPSRLIESIINSVERKAETEDGNRGIFTGGITDEATGQAGPETKT